jgi:bifunctional aspartokinase / homoserine dehydrogenase 1
MKTIKFGGKSLANGQGIKNAVSIIENKFKNKEEIILVLSARGNTTDRLIELLDLAKSDKDYEKQFHEFKNYQTEPLKTINLDVEFKLIDKLLKGTRLTGDFSLKTKDLLLAQGEIISTKIISEILNGLNIKSKAIDSRLFLKTDDNYGNAVVDLKLSEEKTINFFKQQNKNTLLVTTGFIASNSLNETTTLGRNGTNYSASLLANFLNIKEIESYTHVDGIFSANPEIVNNAKIIKNLDYNEASQLSNFGASILHSKSIDPLVPKNISLRILNTFNSNNQGTLISNKKTDQGIKSVSVMDDISLISLIGKGLLGKIGIDARIFSKLSNQGISIGIISQGSSERAISFIIAKKDKSIALKLLLEEFKHEISIQDIQEIKTTDDVSVVTAIGQSICNFASSLDFLKQNKINILLINNTLTENNISIVVNKKDTTKTIQVIHSQIFGAVKTINIAVIGKGTVGGSLINQILKSKSKILQKKNLHLNIFAIAGTKKVILSKNGVSENWLAEYENLTETENHKNAIITFAKENHLENLIAIDNTSSEDFVTTYIDFIENGFDLISSNKIANTQQYEQYKGLRESLKKHNKQYLYETNVGAGLPIIDTLRVLHESGENITRIKGVFSGSLSKTI